MGQISPEYISKEQFDNYCEHIAEGGTVRSGAAHIDKRISKIYEWSNLYATPEQREQYAYAQELSAHIYACKAIEAAEDDNLDIGFTEDGKPFFKGENVQRSRLKVDVYKWSAGKKNPKVYGDKATVVQEGGDKAIGLKHEGEVAITGPIVDHIDRLLKK